MRFIFLALLLASLSTPSEGSTIKITPAYRDYYKIGSSNDDHMEISDGRLVASKYSDAMCKQLNPDTDSRDCQFRFREVISLDMNLDHENRRGKLDISKFIVKIQLGDFENPKVLVPVTINSEDQSYIEPRRDSPTDLLIDIPLNAHCDFSKPDMPVNIDISLDHPDAAPAFKSQHITGHVVCRPMPESIRAEIERKKALDQKNNQELASFQEKQRIAEQEREEASRLAREKEAREVQNQKIAESMPEYKRADAASKIKELYKLQQGAQAALDQERKIGSVSGYVSKDRMRNSGAVIVQSQDAIDAYWKTYKENGGDADNVEALLKQ